MQINAEDFDEYGFEKRELHSAVVDLFQNFCPCLYFGKYVYGKSVLVNILIVQMNIRMLFSGTVFRVVIIINFFVVTVNTHLVHDPNWGDYHIVWVPLRRQLDFFSYVFEFIIKGVINNSS